MLPRSGTRLHMCSTHYCGSDMASRLQRGPGGDATAASAGKDVEAPGGSSTPRSRGPHASEAAARAAAIARSGGGGGGDVAGDLGDFGARVEAGEHAADFQFRASEGGRKAGEVRRAASACLPLLAHTGTNLATLYAGRTLVGAGALWAEQRAAPGDHEQGAECVRVRRVLQRRPS